MALTQREGSLPLSSREVDRESWTDLVALFEARGGPKHCWCMVWRATPEEAKRTDGESRRATLKRRVDDGTPNESLGAQHPQDLMAGNSHALTASPVPHAGIARRYYKRAALTSSNKYSRATPRIP